MSFVELPQPGLERTEEAPDSSPASHESVESVESADSIAEEPTAGEESEAIVEAAEVVDPPELEESEDEANDSDENSEALPEPPPEDTALRCPYCRDALETIPEGPLEEHQASERPMACTGCKTLVHARCAQVHGTCVTHGCRGRSFAFVSRVPKKRRTLRPRPRPRPAASVQIETPAPEEAPSDWLRRDAPLLLLGFFGIVTLAVVGALPPSIDPPSDPLTKASYGAKKP